MTRKILVSLVVLASVAGAGFAVGGDAHDASYAEFGAMVFNWGEGQGGRFGCGNLICGGVPCVTGGKITVHYAPSGKNALICNDAVWLFEVPQGGLFLEISNCGDFGTGRVRVTGSGVTNWACHN